jgi:hypothetical protein
MSETADYSPGDWKGYDFDAARKTYDKHVGRAYDAAQAANKKAKDMAPKKLKTDAKTPIVILCDVTGSMGDWPATIFSKLPYLDNEAKEYFGDDYEISFAATTDEDDSYPLQVREFVKGRKMEEELKQFIVGGGSGPVEVHEAYELSALYYARNVEMPKANKPLLIYICDEHFHDHVNLELAKKVAHVDVDDKLSSKKVFEELKEKFSVYAIRKSYSGRDREITHQWASVLGEDHMAELPSADRVVDVIFGIFAKETGKIDYFKDEIEDRQRPDQVDTVYKSLKTIHALPAEVKDSGGKSVLHTHMKGNKTKRLLP